MLFLLFLRCVEIRLRHHPLVQVSFRDARCQAREWGSIPVSNCFQLYFRIAQICATISSEMDVRFELPAASLSPAPSFSVVFRVMSYPNKRVIAFRYFYIITRSYPCVGSESPLQFQLFQNRSFCKLRMNSKYHAGPPENRLAHQATHFQSKTSES